MPFFLSDQKPELQEYMDDPDADRKKLDRTYRQFKTINQLISRWHFIYCQHLLPDMKKLNRPATVLDIGSGGGDILFNLVKWARQDGIEIRITGIDADYRALDFVRQLEVPDPIQFKQLHTSDLMQSGETFDYVISNHLMHHLAPDPLQQLLHDAKTLSRRRVLFNDIERSDLGYLLFSSIAPLLFHNSFAVKDGKISIKRSYTRAELLQLVSDEWKLQSVFPYRLILSYIHE